MSSSDQTRPQEDAEVDNAQDFHTQSYIPGPRAGPVGRHGAIRPGDSSFLSPLTSPGCLCLIQARRVLSDVCS